MIDTGISLKKKKGEFLAEDTRGYDRLLARWDARYSRAIKLDKDIDKHGHGSHIAGVAASSVLDENGDYNGMAPDANLVSVRAFSDRGKGSYGDIINAISWVIDNKNRYNIRVVNLSFGSPVQSHYWDDPLNQAVMRAWQAGIVVVTSAGNSGPDPMSITVPGNVPYVITVGAATDAYTANDKSDDYLASFSAVGPTHDAFIKPDLITYGGHVASRMAEEKDLKRSYPDSKITKNYYRVSGTSQAAAMVSGAVALMLEAEPGLSPDDVKCRLMASAHAAVDSQGKLAYSPFQQGAGMMNIKAAVDSRAQGCANQGLDIDADLAGHKHFQGPGAGRQ